MISRIAQVLLAAWLCLAGTAGMTAVHAGMVEMQQRYSAFRERPAGDAVPFTLESTEQGRVVSASVAGFLPSLPFTEFTRRLSRASEWCEFIPLHLNVKACMHLVEEGREKLGFFIGVKEYRAPDDAELLLLDFSAGVTHGVFMARFTADTGPYASANYDFQFRAIGVDGGVYLEFDLSSEPGLVAGLARLYLATVGRSKVGFSSDGVRADGTPKYVRGQRGGVERNIVRYLFSIQAYFQAGDEVAGEDPYLDRLEAWFDLTERHPRQLYEMSRRDYIDYKLRERENQRILRQSIADGVEPDYGGAARGR